MKINLKKAAALATAIGAVSVKFEQSFAVDIYSPPPNEDAVTFLRQNLKLQLADALDMVNAVFELRRLIGQANQERINGLLTARAQVDKELSIIGTIAVKKQSTSVDSLAREIAARLADTTKSSSYGGLRALTLDIQTDDITEFFAKPLRKAKRKIDEELQSLNFTTTIELPEGVVKVLTSLDLI